MRTELLGIEVDISAWAIPLPLYGFLLATRWDDWGSLLTGLVAFPVAVLIHELGHASAARNRGYTPLRIEITEVGGLCTYLGRPDPRVSAGGPLTGLAVGALLFALGFGMEGTLRPEPGLARWALVAAHISLFINLTNLVPAHPLDGAALLRAWAHRRGRSLNEPLVGTLCGVALVAAGLGALKIDWEAMGLAVAPVWETLLLLGLASKLVTTNLPLLIRARLGR